MKTLKLVAVLVLSSACAAQKYYAYVGNLGPDSALLAWGTTDGANTIGRSSPSPGDAMVKIAGRTLAAHANWMVIDGLSPDTEYAYEIALKGKPIATNTFRTWAAKADRLAFFVIGDYGNGSRTQFEIAKVMLAEFNKRSATRNPIRFVVTTGDNIYGVEHWFFPTTHTGAEDRDWGPRFFAPYEGLIAHIPFYPTLGNHDGNETESRGDLPAYLDNFFFPANKPARYYSFNYGGLAELFALDNTSSTESGPPHAAYLAGSDEFRWMQAALSDSKAAWKIPYYHHPVFCAGPAYPGSSNDLKPWVDLFSSAGVKVAFNGHEHNFQFSEANARAEGIRFVTSGAGGELRAGDVLSRMRPNNIAGWSGQNHFLVVEIEGKTMQITPVSWESVSVRGADGGQVPMPLVVKLPED